MDPADTVTINSKPSAFMILSALWSDDTVVCLRELLLNSDVEVDGILFIPPLCSARSENEWYSMCC